MKVFTLFLIVAFSLSATSCNQKKDSTPQNENKKSTTVPTDNTVSLDTFNSWVSRWDDNYRSYMASDSLHYFDMPLVDMTTVVNEVGAAKARLYMSMESTKAGMIPHILLVALDSQNEPIFTDIMDYTKACPPLCDAIKD